MQQMTSTLSQQKTCLLGHGQVVSGSGAKTWSLLRVSENTFNVKPVSELGSVISYFQFNRLHGGEVLSTCNLHFVFLSILI